MAYVRVKILAPDGNAYEVEIDSTTDVNSLLKAFIRELRLPTELDGKSVAYELHLVDSLRVQDKSTIIIARKNENAPNKKPHSTVDTNALASPTGHTLGHFQADHSPSKTVFVMMKFSGGDNKKDKKLKGLFDSVRLELDKYGLDAVRADEKNYSTSTYLWDNIQIYLDGCDRGIAILENLYIEEMNPNVALEYGYMLAQGKQVLLLKEKSFSNIRADILGKLWKEFEIDKKDTIQKALSSWMIDLRIPRIKV